MDVDGRGVSVHRDYVVGEIAVDGRAVLRIVSGVLQQRHANAHHHRAHYLVATGERVDDAASVDDGDDPADAQASDLRLPGDFDEVSAEGVGRELRLGIAEGGLALAAA